MRSRILNINDEIKRYGRIEGSERRTNVLRAPDQLDVGLQPGVGHNAGFGSEAEGARNERQHSLFTEPGRQMDDPDVGLVDPLQPVHLLDAQAHALCARGVSRRVRSTRDLFFSARRRFLACLSASFEAADDATRPGGQLTKACTLVSVKGKENGHRKDRARFGPASP